MPRLRSPLRQIVVSCIMGFVALSATIAQDGGTPPPTPEPQLAEAQPPQNPASTPPASNYDKAIFQKPIPADQLAFLNQFQGSAPADLLRDKQFRKLLQTAIPDCTFHYGWDTPLTSALELVLKNSPVPVRIRDGRYVVVSGGNGPYLAGKGFIWIDLQDGIVLGGFYFHPTNGEPTLAVNIFSRQVKEEFLKMSQLPPAFAEDLRRWSAESGVPPVTTRYFITGANKKIVLEHDEDYCVFGSAPTAAPAGDCLQTNLDAADIDMNAAYYLEQTNHATNSTAWMIIGDDQVVWLQVRESTCRVGPDPLRCRLRMTRERTHLIINRHPVPHIAHR